MQKKNQQKIRKKVLCVYMYYKTVYNLPYISTVINQSSSYTSYMSISINKNRNLKKNKKKPDLSLIIIRTFLILSFDLFLCWGLP